MKNTTKVFSVAIIILFLSTIPAFAASYGIDASHSSIGFEVSHLTVSTTKGEFGTYDANIEYDPANPEAAKFEVNIDANSIDTRNSARDKHLKSPDFFDATNHPDVKFVSTKIAVEGDTLVVVGDLTMRGVTKSVELPLKVAGPVVSPFGSTVIGLAGETTINRQEWGISWNKTLDAGGYVVGDMVKIVINVEAAKK